MDLLKHLPSPIAPTFSEALRIDTLAGSWIFISWPGRRAIAA
jgi:hypothetical protein